MSDEYWGLNLDLNDFDNLLKKEDLIEEPVSIETFVRDKKFLGMEYDLSPRQLEMAKHITQILKPETLVQIMGEEKGLEYYNKYTVSEIIAMIGKGGGKDHCLSHETKVLTKNGFIEIGKLAGTTQMLLTEGGRWVEAPINSYGECELLKVTVRRSGITKEIFATPNHRWMLSNNNGSYEKHTIELTPGERLRYVFGQGPSHRNVFPSPFGIARGFCYGDGTDGKVYLYGEKDKHLLPYFAGCKIRQEKWKDRITITGIPNYFKEERPKLFETRSYLYGWLSGYFAADGHVTKDGTASLTSRNKENLEFVQDICGVIGVGCYEISTSYGGGYDGDEKKENYNLTFIHDTLTEDFFIIPEHRERWANNTKKSIRYWNVISIEKTDRFEEVFCAEVPETKSFVIEGNILSGNTSRISFAYVIYLLHCLRDPLSYYGKAHGVTIDLLNLAVNAQQAKNVFFEPLKKILLRSPYFNEIGFEPRVSELFFFSRPIRCFSGHSESEGWEGYEVLLVVLDEISAFKTSAELKSAENPHRAKGSAEGVYNMSKLSVMSRFPDVGKVVLLSFPRFTNDFITSRYGTYEKGNETKTWGLKAATWEFNPTITRESLEPEFQRNPVEAESRFACNPPAMTDPFFREPELVRAAFKWMDDPVKEDGTFEQWFVGSDGYQRFVHIDLGLKRDKAAICMVHCSGLKDVQTMVGIEKLPIINVDFIRSWKAAINSEIPFSEIRQCIHDLGRKFSLASVTFDQWASQEMIQTLRSWGFNADMHNVKKTDYDTLSTTIYDGRLRGYWNEQLVENELLKLKLINNTKVDHPSTGEKDIADALAGATFMCIMHLALEPEIEIEIFNDLDYEALESEADEIIASPPRNFSLERPATPQPTGWQKPWELETL